MGKQTGDYSPHHLFPDSRSIGGQTSFAVFTIADFPDSAKVSWATVEFIHCTPHGYLPVRSRPLPNQRYRESPSGLGDFHAHLTRR